MIRSTGNVAYGDGMPRRVASLAIILRESAGTPTTTLSELLSICYASGVRIDMALRIPGIFCDLLPPQGAGPDDP